MIFKVPYCPSNNCKEHPITPGLLSTQKGAAISGNPWGVTFGPSPIETYGLVVEREKGVLG